MVSHFIKNIHNFMFLSFISWLYMRMRMYLKSDFPRIFRHQFLIEVWTLQRKKKYANNVKLPAKKLFPVIFNATIHLCIIWDFIFRLHFLEYFACDTIKIWFSHMIEWWHQYSLNFQTTSLIPILCTDLVHTVSIKSDETKIIELMMIFLC